MLFKVKPKPNANRTLDCESVSLGTICYSCGPSIHHPTCANTFLQMYLQITNILSWQQEDSTKPGNIMLAQNARKRRKTNTNIRQTTLTRGINKFQICWKALNSLKPIKFAGNLLSLTYFGFSVLNGPFQSVS